MELPTHPLLALVESNRNGLKSMLTHYIDSTVDNQFAFLKNHIVLMIQSDQIGPQQSHDVTAFGTTLPPQTQTNTDQSSTESLIEYSNDQLRATLEAQFTRQHEVSQANTINTDDQMIKQEFDDEEEENEDGEEIDEDNVMHCENCEKGICNSVRENYHNTRDDTDMGESRDEHFETQLIISNDISPSPSPTNPINSEPLIKQEYPQGSSIAIPLDFNTNANDISIDEVHEPIEGQNTQIQTDEFDDNDDVDDDDYESDQNEYLTNSNCEDCVNGVCDLDHENNNNHSNNEVPTEDGDETDIEHNLDGDEQLQNDIRVPKNNQINNQNDEENVINERSVSERNIEQSTPSTSAVRSSTRKRIPKKVFGDMVQSNVNPRSSAKRKSDQTNKCLKKVKRVNVLDNGDAPDSDDQEDEKGQIKIVELHCTEPGCSQISTSRALWREHMWNDHHKRPYHQHESNVQLNHGKYLCTQSNCNTTCTTQGWLKTHWSRNHHSGKYKCPSCPFVANLFFKVQNHFDTNHGSHGCTHCGKKFPDASQLKRHKRVHTDERPYKCTWEKCQSSFKQIGTAFQHVRLMHFNLPKSTKEQNELNIIDLRNAHDYIRKLEHLL